jgi:hypothetical protein
MFHILIRFSYHRNLMRRVPWFGQRHLLCAAVLLISVLVLHAELALAGFAGHNTKGDYGLQSGSQLPPGMYLYPMYYGYDGSDLKNSDGDSVRIDPEGRGSLDINAYVLGRHVEF